MAIVGNYELVARLATGGMAETHVARSLVDGSIVVVKQLLPRYAGNVEFIEMFVDEGRVISSLRHPNVVAMREFGYHNELPYLAMEYLHGVDLRTLTRTLVLRRKMRVPPEVAIYVASAMCAGLHHAHVARTIDGKPMDITHRDVSPQNVVLTFDGAVKLIDFGIATARGRMHETRSGALKGKIPYMAPEQVRAGATDRRTDVYATGVVLYEMLSGKRPYVGKHTKLGEFSLMMAIVNHMVVPLDTIQDVPPSLANVVMKSIAADPTQRYQTAEEMCVALDAVAVDLGVVPSPAHLVHLLNGTFGTHRVPKALASSQQVKELVSSIEDARTKVDESHDPLTVEQSHLTPHATTGKLSATEDAPPVFEDVEITDRSQPLVDKIVEANVTRLRFHRSMEDNFRWGKLFDGIEGTVEVDFAGVADMTSPSIRAACEAMRNLGDEVSEVRLIAAPIGLAMELEDRCRVVSVTCRGRCPACQTATTAELGYDEIRERLAAGGPLPCRKCGTGLIDIELGRSSYTPSHPLPVVGPRSSIRMLVAMPPSTAEMSVQPAQVAKPPRRARRGHAWFVVLVLACGAAIGVTIVLKQRSSRENPASQPSAVTAPDGWTVEVEADGATELEVTSMLYLKALRAAIAQIESELPQSIRMLGVQPLERAVLTLDGRSEAHVEIQQRTIAWTRKPALHARARYAMTATAKARLKTYYAEIKTLGGFELANAPPSRPPAVLVLSAPPSSNTSPGDRVVSIGGRAVSDLADVPADGGRLELVVEHRERRTIAAVKER